MVDKDARSGADQVDVFAAHTPDEYDAVDAAFDHVARVFLGAFLVISGIADKRGEAFLMHE